MSRTIAFLISAAGFAFFALSVLDWAQAAGAPAKGLAFIRLELPDGTRWVLGEGAIGRPFMARLVLANHGNAPIRIWDPKDSEGSTSPRVVLADNKGHKTTLLPRPIPRLAGVPVPRTLAPSEVMVIELELLRLVDVASPPPPGDYAVTAEYVATPTEEPPFQDLWHGDIRSQSVAIQIVPPAAAKANH